MRVTGVMGNDEVLKLDLFRMNITLAVNGSDMSSQGKGESRLTSLAYVMMLWSGNDYSRASLG